MLSISTATSSAGRVGVLPSVTESLGPRTAAAGFCATTWWTTSQSKSIRSDESACLTLAGSSELRRQRLDVGGDVLGADVADVSDAVLLAPAQKEADLTSVASSGVAVADRGDEEIQKMPGGVFTGGGDQCRDVSGVRTGRCEGSCLSQRGLKKVRAEFSLTALAYNFIRVVNIMGVASLLKLEGV